MLKNSENNRAEEIGLITPNLHLLKGGEHHNPYLLIACLPWSFSYDT